jgi:Mg2+ and Co2+ transporter CorA
MSVFRFPVRSPANDIDEISDDEIDEVWETRRRFVEETEQELDDWFDNVVHARSDGEEWPDPPNPLESELMWVGDQLARLESYRDRLIVFARSFASDTVPVRTIGQHTGLSHSTVVRMITEEAIEDIAPIVGAVAEKYLTNDLDPRDDPDLYRRLRSAVNAGARAES